MIALVNSFAFALLVTTVTVFRFGVTKKLWIGLYFFFVLSASWAIDVQFSAENAVGIELAVVLLAIWVLFSIAFMVIRKQEKG